jgi:hypothetical protein
MTLGEYWPQPGMVAGYHLSDVNDFSGNGYTLTNGGTVTFGIGRFNNCAQLGSTNSTKTLTRGDTCGINIANAFTWSTWVMIQTAPAEAEIQFIMNIRQTAPTDLWTSTYYTMASGVLKLVAAFGAAYANYTVTLPLNVWHHIVVVSQTGAGTISLYLNGAMVASIAKGVVAGGDSHMGLGGYAGPSLCMKGNIDESAIFSSEKTAQWVRNQYRIAKYGE